MAFFKPLYDNYWEGNLKKYGLDYRVRDECGRTDPEWTVVDQFIDDSSSAATSGACDGSFMPTSQSFWSTEADGEYVDKGGVGARLKDRMPGDSSSLVPTAPYYDWRNIYTYINGINGALDPFIPTNANITNGVLAVTSDITRFRIINFMYGYTYDAASDSTPLSKRKWVLGDIIHSEPKVIDYFDDNDLMTHRYIAVGANDGMLHVFTDSDVTLSGNSYLAGDEIFAFIPRDLLPRLQEFSDPETHKYMVDGSVALYRSSTKSDGTNYDLTLVFGERAGGRSYWALDISNPNPANWKVKWHIDGGPGGTAGFEELGYTWSKPFFARMRIDGTTTKGVVIFAGGYDPIEDGFPEPFDDQNKNGKRDAGEPFGVTVGGSEGYDEWNHGIDIIGRGIFIVDVADGSILFKATYGASDITTGISQNYAMMKYCFPADISVIPLSDSLIVMYAADMYGQIWSIRYDYYADLAHSYTDSASTKWSVTRVFTANPGSTLASGDATAFINNAQSLNSTDAGRKMFYSPDVSLFGNDWTSSPVLYVGTGDRQHPRYTMISNRIYLVTDTGDLADETDLLNLTCDELDADATVSADTKTELRNILLNGTNGVRGLYRVLDKQGTCGDDDTNHMGEQILSQPTLFYKNVYFTSYQPDFDDPCNPVGNAFIYALNYSFGTAAFNYDVNNDTAIDEVRTLKDTFRFISGSSIPSGVRVIMRDGHAAGLISAGGAVAGVGENGSTNIPGPPGGITPLLWETE
jgi:type IV pilus assembly protein PilY1